MKAGLPARSASRGLFLGLLFLLLGLSRFGQCCSSIKDSGLLQDEETTTTATTSSSTPVACAGCFSEVETHDETTDEVVRFVVSEVSRSMSGGGGDGLRLDSVIRIEQQVVAGMKFKVSIRLRRDSGNNVECREIIVFQPLPFQCEKGPGDENPKCLEIMDGIGEKCQ